MNLFQFAGREYGDAMGIVQDPVRFVVGKHPIWVQTVVARADRVRGIGGFDPDLRYSEDHDFLFRMALETKFCFVNMPMVLVDRAPAENRHQGESRNWHKEEFRLRMDQIRFEKQAHMSAGQPADVCGLIQNNLSRIHSNWVNLYLEKGENARAREAMALAVKFDPSLALRFKSLLLRISPALTRRVLAVRDRKPAPRYDRLSWKTSSESKL